MCKHTTMSKPLAERMARSRVLYAYLAVCDGMGPNEEGLRRFHLVDYNH